MSSPGPTVSSRSVGSRRKRIIFVGLFAALLLGATVVLLEVGLRLLPYVLPEPQASFLSEAARIPLCNTRMYRGVAILLPDVSKADLLVVGDSIPFGTNVAAEHTFAAQLGRETGTTVVNLGVGSQSPPQYNRMLEVGARYRPSRVLYCVFANDFDYRKPVPVPVLSTEHSRQTLPGDQELFIETPSLGDRLHLARKSVSNLFLSFQLYKLHRQPSQQVKHVPWKKDSIFYSFVGKDFWDGLSYDSPEVRRAVDVNARLAGEAWRFCRSIDASLVVVLFPSKEMVYGPLLDLGGEIYEDAHHRTYREFRAKLDEAGVPCLDLTEELREAAGRGEKLYFSIDGHFNEHGHEMIAQLLAEHLGMSRGGRVGGVETSLTQ